MIFGNLINKCIIIQYDLLYSTILDIDFKQQFESLCNKFNLHDFMSKGYYLFFGLGPYNEQIKYFDEYAIVIDILKKPKYDHEIYKQKDNYLTLFNYFIKNKNLKGLFMFNYSHMFYRDNINEYLYELIFLIQLNKKIPMYPDPLLIFLIESRMYYYVLQRLSRNVNYKNIILLSETVIDINMPFVKDEDIKNIIKNNYPDTDLDKLYLPIYLSQNPNQDFNNLTNHIKKYMKRIKINKPFIKFAWSGMGVSSGCIEPCPYKQLLYTSHSQILVFQQTLYPFIEIKFFKLQNGEIIPTNSSRKLKPIAPNKITKYKEICEIIKDLNNLFGFAFYRIDFFIQKDSFYINEIELFPSRGSCKFITFNQQNSNIIILKTFLKKTTYSVPDSSEPLKILTTLINKKFSLNIQLEENYTILS